MSTLPLLITDAIDYYRYCIPWKQKIKNLNEEYHRRVIHHFQSDQDHPSPFPCKWHSITLRWDGGSRICLIEDELEHKVVLAVMGCDLKRDEFHRDRKFQCYFTPKKRNVLKPIHPKYIFSSGFNHPNAYRNKED
jgi:hypothetical protein